MRKASLVSKQSGFSSILRKEESSPEYSEITGGSMCFQKDAWLERNVSSLKA